MAAARSLPSPLLAATYETLVGLLAVTGMRIGEAIALDRGDVVLAQGGCGATASSASHRRAPAAATTVEALRRLPASCATGYARARHDGVLRLPDGDQAALLQRPTTLHRLARQAGWHAAVGALPAPAA